MVLVSILLISLLLFVVIKTSQAAVAIKATRYDDAYNDIKLVAITTGILLFIVVALLILNIYLTFRYPGAALG